MVKELKTKVTDTKKVTVKRWKRFVELVETVSLLTVAVYAGYTALHDTRTWYTYPVVFAAVLIGLVGAQHFVKHLDAK